MATYNTLIRGSTGADLKKLQQSLMDNDYKTDPTRPRVSVELKNATLGELPKAVETAPEANQTHKTTPSPAPTQQEDAPVQKAPAATKQANTPVQKANGGFKQSDKVTDAYNRSSDAEKAWQDHINSGFTYGREEDYNSIFDKILNREDFKFDLNGDALYKQYKDKYITQGKMAMQDTMGQAAAMTGGYGNSYAASVGNQAYQQSLQQLNDVVPELYQMAYDRYAQEGQDLYNEYSLLSADRNAQYGEWADKGNQLLTDRGYYADRADTEYSKEYGEYRNDVADEQWQKTFDYGKERDKASDAENERSFAYGQAMNSIQAGIVPSDDVLAAAGMTKEEAESLANAYKNSGTGKGEINLTVQEWTDITNNAKKIIETAKLNKVADGGEMELFTYLKELLRGSLISEEGLLSIMELYFPSAKTGESVTANTGVNKPTKPSVKPELTLK